MKKNLNLVKKLPEKLKHLVKSSLIGKLLNRNVRLTQVCNIIDLTPHLRRIVITGEDLLSFPVGEEGAHVKVLFPAEGQHKPNLELNKAMMRSYTIEQYDSLTNELSLDFVVNCHHGLATNWALQAKIGDYIGIAGPGAKKMIDFTSNAFLLVGDLTSINAVNAFAKSTPTDAKVHALIQVPSASDITQLNNTFKMAEHVCVQWLIAGEDNLSNTVLTLADELPKNTKVFLGLEATEVRSVKSTLLEQLNIERLNIHSSAYWTIGKRV